MRQAKQGLCAIGLLVLAAAGCTLPDALGLSYLQTSAPGQGRVVAASLESVSASTQATLRELGATAVVTQSGEDVRIAYTTRSGNHFALVLTRVRTAQGEQTRMRLEGETEGNEPTYLRVLAKFDSH
jgi:hypothetical protein